MKNWLIACLLFPVFALASPVNSGHVEAELVAENANLVAGEENWIALRLTMDPGWHTYWRNPGDSGAPTTIDWSMPEGVMVSEFSWPIPEWIEYGPLVNLGYHDTILLPMKITVPASMAGNNLTLNGQGTWLVCADVCIPESAPLSVTLPVAGEPGARVNGAMFDAAFLAVPRPFDVTATVAAAGEQVSLTVPMTGLSEDRIERILFLPYTADLIDLPAGQPLAITPDGLTLTLTPGWDYAPGVDMTGILLVEEIEGGAPRAAFEISLAPGAAPAASTAVSDPNAEMSLWLAMLFAFLGGLILNLMPCVFPVLSIKILSLVEGVSGESGALTRHGWVYAVGVVLSFLAIALTLVALQAAGEQIGWGFQLQSPIVVGLLFYLFVLIGLNLAGWFEFGTSMMSTGGDLADKGGYAGSFFTGVLATVVAAPCTAPFMGAAIGFALTRSVVEIVLTFGALGFGMAVPYLLLCYFPALLRKLPPPGNWMVRLKEFLAYPMYGSAVWLLWVLNQQTGPDGLLAVTSGLVLLVFAIWLLKQSWRPGRAVAVLTIGASLYLVQAVTWQAPVVASVADAPSAAGARPVPQDLNPSAVYSPDALATARAEGAVFVNFTAAWCITCKVNEVAVLNTDATRELFEANGVTYLKGDWTNEDPVITEALQRYGRSGVPLYLLYRPGSDRAEVLPQILTAGIVESAMETNKISGL